MSTKTAGNHFQAQTKNQITLHSRTNAKTLLIPKSFDKMSRQEPRTGMLKRSQSSKTFWFPALRFLFSECRPKTLASASLPLNLPLPETTRYKTIQNKHPYLPYFTPFHHPSLKPSRWIHFDLAGRRVLLISYQKKPDLKSRAFGC